MLGLAPQTRRLRDKLSLSLAVERMPGGAAELQLSAVSEGTADDLSGTEVVNYTYHANNLLTGIATDQRLMASYTYDVHGRRISKTVNGSTTLCAVVGCKQKV